MLEKRDLEMIKEIVETSVEASEKRLEGKIEASEKRLESKIEASEKRLEKKLTKKIEERATLTENCILEVIDNLSIKTKANLSEAIDKVDPMRLSARVTRLENRFDEFELEQKRA